MGSLFPLSSLGALGFSWGGAAVLKLGSDPHRTVDAVVAIHPHRIADEEDLNMRVPTQVVVGSEGGSAFGQELSACHNLLRCSSLVRPERIVFEGGAVYDFAMNAKLGDFLSNVWVKRSRDLAANFFKEYLWCGGPESQENLDSRS
jgi:dienelactone hydrolase